MRLDTRFDLRGNVLLVHQCRLQCAHKSFDFCCEVEAALEG